MSSEQDFSDTHRHLGETFSSLHRVFEPLCEEDREQVLKILRLVTQVADELTILSQGKHRKSPPS